MKTRNFLIAIVLISGIVLNINKVRAEGGITGPTSSDNVTLKIRLQPIQTIVVNQKTVEFLYASTDDYSTGVTNIKNPDHLTVFSTGGFEVSVKANGDFKRESGTETIEVSDVTVKAEKGTGEKNVGKFKEVSLSETGGSLITADAGGRNMNYTVTYDNAAGGKDKYIDKYFEADGTESVYTTEVTYTIAAK